MFVVLIVGFAFHGQYLFGDDGTFNAFNFVAKSGASHNNFQ